MIASGLHIGLQVLFWTIAIAAVAWPSLALVIRSVNEGIPSVGELVPSARQLGLLGKSAILAGIGALAALIASVPAAAAFAGARAGRERYLLGLSACVLLCPPMVYAFGWQRLLLPAVGGNALCVLVWAGWAWPIPALVLAAGWRASRPAFEAALLEVGPARTVGHVLVPALAPFAAAGLLLLFVIFFSDYGVPHACGLVVYATETLGWATNSTRASDTVWPSLPGVAVILGGLAGFVLFSRRGYTGEQADYRPGVPGLAGGLTIVLVLVFGVVPMAALIAKLGSPGALAAALRTYRGDLWWSVVVAVFGGAGIVAVAAGLAGLERSRKWLLGWAILWGALPGALIGTSLVMAYNRPATAWIYDHWPILALSAMARFAWVGGLAALVMARDLRGETALAAELDGATRGQILMRLVFPRHLRLLVSVGAVAAALSLAEVPTTALVRVPAFTPISAVIIEKFHRLEDQMLIALSLVLVTSGVVAAALVGAIQDSAGDRFVRSA